VGKEDIKKKIVIKIEIVPDQDQDQDQDLDLDHMIEEEEVDDLHQEDMKEIKEEVEIIEEESILAVNQNQDQDQDLIVEKIENPLLHPQKGIIFT
jgi:hypothetical protein